MADATDDNANDGILQRLFRKVFGKSWRTSSLGYLTLLASIFTVVASRYPSMQTAVEIVRDVTPLLMGSGMLFAKDARVSGLPDQRRGDRHDDAPAAG